MNVVSFKQRILLHFRNKLNRLHTAVGKIRFRVIAYLWGISAGCNCVFVGKAAVRTLRDGQIVLGSNCRFTALHCFNPIVSQTPTVLDTRHGGRIVIGDNFKATSPFIGSAIEISIGNNVMVSGGVKIMDTNFHSIFPADRLNGAVDEFPAKVVIEDDVFIGVGATVLKGSHIGARSVIAAGSVVVGLQIPPDSIVAGNPAQVVTRKGSRR